MESRKEIKLTVPADLVRKSCGIAIDMGASVFKAVYRSQEDMEEAESLDTKTGHLTLLSISGKNVREAVDYLSSKAKINREPGSGLIYTTGLGCTVHGKLMTEKLNVKMENLTEFDCFVKSFHYLAAHLPRADLFENFETEAAEKPVAAFMKHFEVLKTLIADGKTAIATGFDLNGPSDPLAAFVTPVSDSKESVAEAEKDLYPCILAMCGSGCGYMVVNADGTFRIIDSSHRGGTNFFGLGSLLTGCQTFEELLDLAARGEPKNVDMYSDSLLEGCAGADGEDSLYSRSATIEGTLCHCFGKTPGRKIEDFKKEDLARALLDQFVLDIVQTTMLVASVAGVKRICFAGSFLASPLLRRAVTAEWIKRGFFISIAGQPIIKFDFLKAGPHLGAVGALITHYQKYVSAAEH